METEHHTYNILMFPWLAHGHIFPFLNLSKKLSETGHFTIYLCSTAVNLDSIRSTLEQHKSSIFAPVNLVELHLSSSELPPQLHTTTNLPPNLIPTLIQAFQTSSSSLSEIMDSLKPDLLIYDFFQPWAPQLASSKGIPSVYFLTSSATSFCYYHHVYTMGTGSTFPYKAISLPDSDVTRQRNFIRANLQGADNDFAFGNFTRSTEIVLVKSCSEIELKYIEYFSILCKKKIVCTGPLISGADKCNDDESSEIMKWLSSKNHSSTLYISFGSEYFPSKNQIAEIAKGLLLLDVNFLWILRFPFGTKSTIEEELPEEFLETVKDRGLVVSRWAPQTKILGHPSIGGFMSHCGWSSVVETMYYGVPVIAMPMRSDQPLNAQLVVECGVGVGVEKDENGVYVGEEVAAAISKVIVERTFYEGMRNKARRLSEAIKGTEEQEVNETVEQLLMISMKNKKIV